MKKLATTLTIALGAVTLTACDTTTSPDLEACVAALDAADQIIAASADIAEATIPLISEIAPALEAAINHNPDGMEPLLDATNNLTAVTEKATQTVNHSNYETHRDQCLNQ